MENYHLFIADENSLKYHIEYGFVGTGKQSDDFSIGLWKDIQRLNIGDKVIFYVQKLKKFYGIFEVTSKPFFDVSEPLYLKEANPVLRLKETEQNVSKESEQKIRLRYRALIKPFRLYPNGIEEFDLIDILPAKTEDVLWSILYRKLKGKRGTTPLFPSEYNTISEKLAAINDDVFGLGTYSFLDERIVQSSGNYQYAGNIHSIPNIKNGIFNEPYKEDNLHALLLEHLPNEIFGQNLLWVGNEVYSGAAMQAIDLMSISRSKNQNIYNIIEVKRGEVENKIIDQIKKYSRWVAGRFNLPNPENVIQPTVLGLNSTERKRKNRSKKIIEHNSLNLSLPIKYFEYRVERENNKIIFTEYNMNSENLEIINEFEV